MDVQLGRADRAPRGSPPGGHGPAIALFAIALNGLALSAGAMRMFGGSALLVAHVATRTVFVALALGVACLGWYAWRRALPHLVGMTLSLVVSSVLGLLAYLFSGVVGAFATM